MGRRIARVGGWTLLVVALACAVAGLVAPPAEWRIWGYLAAALLIGGMGSLVWGYRDELSFSLEK